MNVAALNDLRANAAVRVGVFPTVDKKSLSYLSTVKWRQCASDGRMITLYPPPKSKSARAATNAQSWTRSHARARW